MNRLGLLSALIAISRAGRDIGGSARRAARCSDIRGGGRYAAFEAVSWHALVAPAATPKPIVDALHLEMKRIMASPQIMKHVADLGLIPFDTPAVDDIKAYIKLAQQRWPRRSPTSHPGSTG